MKRGILKNLSFLCLLATIIIVLLNADNTDIALTILSIGTALTAALTFIYERSFKNE